MNLIPLICVVIAVAGMYSTIAKAQTATELRPSLEILRKVSTAMPDFRQVVFYEAFPDSQGKLIKGIGNSTSVRGWFFQMKPIVPKFLEIDDRLNADVTVYRDTVREEGGKVLKATEANFNASLVKFDTATVGKVQDLLALYDDEVKETRNARSKYERAKKAAEEATVLLDANDADAEECNLLLKKAKLRGDKTGLLSKIKEGSAFLNTLEKVIGSTADGPEGVASYLAGKAVGKTVEGVKEVIIDVFYATTRNTIYHIDLQIEAIDEALEEIKCKKQSNTLQAAKLNLEAKTIDILLSLGDIVRHRAKAWRVVDRLGTLKDRDGRSFTFFQQLQSYNAQVNTMGRKVSDSVTAYLDLLARDPLARGDLVLNLVDDDIQIVQREKGKRDPLGKWTEVAGGVKVYLNDYARWYVSELKQGQKVLEDLREGKHLDFVDKMFARATKELGGTVSVQDVLQ